MYSIREATPDDLRVLPAIEQAAGMMYLETRYAELASAANTSERTDLSREHVWVVTAGVDVVAFAIVREFPSTVHIHELDVHPHHARQGLGRRLVEHVTQWAGARAATQLTLTTFDDVPWNGPYYRRLGFRKVELDLTTHLREILEREAAVGIPMEHRIAMRMDIATRGTDAATIANLDTRSEIDSEELGSCCRHAE